MANLFYNITLLINGLYRVDERSNNPQSPILEVEIQAERIGNPLGVPRSCERNLIPRKRSE